MIKALIICSNFEVIKELINKILCKVEDLKIIGISNNLKISELESQTDLIITNNVELVSSILNNKALSSLKIIFISTSNVRRFNSKKILEINCFSADKLIENSLRYFINKSFNNLSKKKVIKILKSIGFDFKLVGTLYIVDSIIYIHSVKGLSFDSLSRDVYPYIAALNNTTVNRIKWSVERSIKYLYLKNSEQNIKNISNYFGIKYPDKITPKLLINFISNNLQE